MTQIFKIKFNNNILFAVKDPGISRNKKSILDLPKNKKYFNSEVMFIDCCKWKRSMVTKKVLNYLKNNPNKIEFPDQDALNAILKDDWQELDPAWNVITRFFYSRIFPLIKIYDYSKEEIKRNRKNPKIIHYATTIKPWFFLDVDPQKKVYRHYLKKTPWKDYTYPDATPLGLIRRIFAFVKFGHSKLLYLKKMG